MQSPIPCWAIYRQPLVRDLAWCVFSPALIRSNDPGIDSMQLRPTATQLDFLQQLDHDPAALSTWMAAGKHNRLGLRFERYWQFWLCRGPGSESHIARIEHRFNLQIPKNGKTLGEIDAVSYDASSATLLHRELAVKFYLGIESCKLSTDIQPATPCCWVGSNVRDRLDLKTQQLLERQMQLLKSSTAIESLPPQWHWQQLQRQVIVRGRLFYPLQKQFPEPDPITVNPQHLRGLWLPVAAAVSLQGEFWSILKRQQWFAPVYYPFDGTGEQRLDRVVFSRDEMVQALAAHFAHSRQALQIASIAAGTDGWHEQQRLFVVADHWPSTT